MELRNRISCATRYSSDPTRAIEQALDRICYCEAISRVMLDQPADKYKPAILFDLLPMHQRAKEVLEELTRPGAS